MLKVEYVEEQKYERKTTKIVINGIYDEHSYKSEYSDEISVNFMNEEIINILMDETIDNLLSHFDEVKIPLPVKHYPVTISEHDWSSIIINKKGNNGFLLKFRFQYETDEWAYNYSLRKLMEAFEKNCSNLPLINFVPEDEEVLSNGFKFWSYYSNKDIEFSEIILDFSEQINKLFNETVWSLKKQFKSNSLNIEFNVDDDIRNACEQYLIYFTQFLKDIGIEASSSIREEAQKILFSVTPCDSNVALERIKNALEIYLELPKHSEVIENNAVHDPAVFQLQSIIHHLHSQLALARATIEAKNTTISLLELMNASEVPFVKKVNNEEELLDGIIKVTEYEKNGVKINIPELLRRLKRRFD